MATPLPEYFDYAAARICTTAMIILIIIGESIFRSQPEVVSTSDGYDRRDGGSELRGGISVSGWRNLHISSFSIRIRIRISTWILPLLRSVARRRQTHASLRTSGNRSVEASTSGIDGHVHAMPDVIVQVCRMEFVTYEFYANETNEREGV